MVQAFTPVPFLDLGAMHAGLRDTLVAEFSDLIDSGAFVNGPAVHEFEQAFAIFCGSRFSVGVANGLDALRLALEALEIERGDEVIVPAQTFAATLEAVVQAGAIPRPVDISPSDWNIDPAAVSAAITDRTRILLPVHLYGQMADMQTLGALAERHALGILEDACQAHGADRDGIAPGAVGLAAAFSFYPGKNLGAMGDAGALVTNDEQIDEQMRSLREHGQRAKYEHDLVGWTSRLDTLQAIVLIHKLPFLQGWNDQRRGVAVAYNEGLHGIGDLFFPPVPLGSNPVWHLYVVQTASPGRLTDHLAARGIRTGRHYPQLPPLSPAFASLGCREGDFPVAERLAREGLSLPIFPGMTEGQTAAVIDATRAYFDG